MKKTAPLLLLALLVAPACRSTESGDASADHSSRAATSAHAEWSAYGAAIADAEPVMLDDLLAHPERYDGQEVLLEGTVDDVCPKKGCWMRMNADGEEVLVKFKDYGFFVPMDIHGSTARMEGRFDVTEIPVDEARHYLEDAGRHEEAAKITEPQRSYVFIASGVRIAQPGS